MVKDVNTYMHQRKLCLSDESVNQPYMSTKEKVFSYIAISDVYHENFSYHIPDSSYSR